MSEKIPVFATRSLVLALALTCGVSACQPQPQPQLQPQPQPQPQLQPQAQPQPQPQPRASPKAHETPWLTDDAAPIGGGPLVSVLGDSLTHAAHDELHSALHVGGHSSIILSAVGEGAAGGPWTDSQRLAEPWMVESAREHAALTPEVAVVALGGNDAWLAGLTLDETLPALGKIIDSYPADTCIIGVLVAEDTPAVGYDVVEAAAINDLYRAQADVTADWRLTATDIASDGIHATSPDAMVASIIDAIASCPTSPPASPT